MRQESRFQADAGSYAGARGLMQIMPATGREWPRTWRVQEFDIDQLFDPEVSINMGAYYLKQQLNGFGATNSMPPVPIMGGREPWPAGLTAGGIRTYMNLWKIFPMMKPGIM
ncbi:MAG: transglycosylase SLT domain-containing protein [Actinomycetota bacterium]|nr:transglycosylase SLT domain-containing protein [Actinomycetota bacterium]